MGNGGGKRLECHWGVREWLKTCVFLLCHSQDLASWRHSGGFWHQSCWLWRQNDPGSPRQCTPHFFTTHFSQHSPCLKLQAVAMRGGSPSGCFAPTVGCLPIDSPRWPARTPSVSSTSVHTSRYVFVHWSCSCLFLLLKCLVPTIWWPFCAQAGGCQFYQWKDEMDVTPAQIVALVAL